MKPGRLAARTPGRSFPERKERFPLARSYGVEIIRKEKDGDCPHGPTNDQNQRIHVFTTFLSPPGDIGRLRLPGVSNLAPSASILRFPR